MGCPMSGGLVTMQVIFGLVAAFVVGVFILGGIAMIAAAVSMPAVLLAEAVHMAAAPSSEQMQTAALACGIALVIGGVGLGIRLRRRLLTVFTVRGRGQFVDFLAYFLIVTLVAGGLLGISRLDSPQPTIYPYGTRFEVVWILGAVVLAPIAWWLIRRVRAGMS